MENIKSLLSKGKIKKLLAIYPHPDDESFVSAGLFQALEAVKIKTKVIFLTCGENHKNKNFDPKFMEIRKKELKKASKILGIDDTEILNHTDGDLIQSKNKWSKELSKYIKSYSPDIVLTYDPSGVTGHPDHVVTSIEVYNILKQQKSVELLWRVPDVNEKEHFQKGFKIIQSANPTHYLNLTFGQSLKKLKAIFSYKSQFRNLIFRFRILEWYLFDHKELYHLVNFRKKIDYQISF